MLNHGMVGSNDIVRSKRLISPRLMLEPHGAPKDAATRAEALRLASSGSEALSHHDD